jgi:hypothetical protein
MSHLEALHFVFQTQLVCDYINNHSLTYFRSYNFRNFLCGRKEIIVNNNDKKKLKNASKYEENLSIMFKQMYILFPYCGER